MFWLRCGSMLLLMFPSASLRAQVAGGVIGMPGGAAQTPAVEPSTGTVTGVVIAQDTQRPARFVNVQLQRVPAADGSGQGQGNFGGGFVNVRTDIDGAFTATHVAAGDYYVFATAAGYISEGSLLRAQAAAGGDPAALLAALPVVRVTADSSSNVTVTMQRGGVIAGHVEWEDGSPATGLNMSASASTAATPLPQSLRGFAFGQGTPFAQTDDRGNFRITGLATGEYVLSATVQVSQQIGGFGRLQGYVSPIVVYAPGVFRKSDAKTIEVRAGDERTDARIVIDLRGLHTVSGHANSSNPGESVATGGVHLVDSSAGSMQLQTQIDAAGDFKLRYVPPGTYTLRITGANSVAPVMINFRGGRGDGDRGSTQPKGVAYQDFSTTITVSDTDVTGVAVSLVPKPSQ